MSEREKKRGKKNIYNRKKKKKKIREKKGYWEDVRHTAGALNGGTSLPSPSPWFVYDDGGMGNAR